MAKMKIKKKTIPLIISAVIFLAGCITAIIGANMKNGNVQSYPELDIFSITDEEAMNVTSDASWERKDQTGGTEWSCDYNLDEFTVDICLDRDYEAKYSFTQEDFR